MSVARAGRRGAAGIGPLAVLAGCLCAALSGLSIGMLVHRLERASPSAPSAAVDAPPGASSDFHGEARWAAGVLPAPAIRGLRDQNGTPFSWAALRGHPVALAFMDSRCTAACPLEGRALAAAEQALPGSERPVVIVVSVNPADTRVSVEKAAQRWGLARTGPWHWLMAPRRALARVWASYRIAVSPRPVDGDIAHTEALLLIDARGDERSGYLWPFVPRLVSDDLRRLALRTRG